MPAPLDPLFVEFQEAVAGRYSLERELGRGGMGVVYLARDVRLDRGVAIKLLPPEMAAQPALRERFVTEARTAARLSHPYIVPIHAVEEAADFVFYVMTYVDGETLAERVRSKGPLNPADATRILREVAWALAYAHAQGIVHRDVKPANILLERGTNRALVTDFGIARVASGGNTGEGELLGTPEYMSPEQAAGEAVDGRSDLYALGVVGHFALTGSVPFTGGAREVLAQQITRVPPPVSQAAGAIPAALANAIDRCLLKNADDRFPTGEALAEALAAAPDRRNDVPVPVRVFLDRRRNAAALAAPAAALGLFGAAAIPLLVSGNVGSGLMVGGLTLVLASLGPMFILARLRKLLALGYSNEDIAAGMRQLVERRREEFVYEFGSKPTVRERGLRMVAGVSALTFVGVSLAAALAPDMTRSFQSLIPISAYVTGIGLVVSERARRLRLGKGSIWSRFWLGRVGRAFTRIAGINLRRRAIIADRPTELGIAMNAESLYAELPKEVRRGIGDVPAVLRQLETHARAIRARIAELEASLVEARRTPQRAPDVQKQLVADLEGTRAAAEKRLAEVVTALETLRLNLLRLRAGAGGVESVTQDLAAAQELGQDVERLLAGHEEVRKVLEVRNPAAGVPR